MRIGRILLLGLAAASVGLSLLNASWLAPKPSGQLVLIAHRGVAQGEDPDAPCGAAAIAPGGDLYIENSIFSMHHAVRLGARGLAVDLRLSRDGVPVAFRDAALDCRTDGSGPVEARSLAELKRLDIGHGYTADGGASFPLRGRGVGAMPTAEEIVRTFAAQRLLFHVRTEDPAAADALLAAFAAARVEPGAQHMLLAPPAVAERMRALGSAVTILDAQASEACFTDYRATGWTGIVPDSCRETLLAVPTTDRWMIWGWPYRFLARMASADARVLMLAERPRPGRLIGLTRPEQLSEVPRDYRGLLLIEDMRRVGGALAR
jgi:glycerophosphoryl diester phosphodiesterase